MQYEDYVKSYERKSNEELTRLQLKGELTPEATVALANELAKRSIDAGQISAFRDKENRRKEELSRNPGRLFLHFHWGIGRWYFGKAGKIAVHGTEMERFRTTVFVLILFFPLIPSGTYLVEKKGGSFTGKITVLKKLPLDWSQIAKVWAVALACLALVIWIPRRA